MKKKIAVITLCLTFTLSMPLSLGGCGKPDGGAESVKNVAGSMTEAEKEDVPGGAAEAEKPTRDVSGDTADFAVKLFQNSLKEKENTLISPLSVLYALGMTANGARGETLAQIEEVLGLKVEDLNAYMNSYICKLPTDEKYKLKIANSIWLKEDKKFTVEQDFLNTNEKYYGAGVYKAPFGESTLKAINEWVNENTDGMIEEVLDSIPKDAVMYLINAIAFDAEWQTIYEEYQVRRGSFTREDKTTEEVEFMYSTENQYLRDDKAQGFLKYYKDGKYAFAALLPDEGVSVSEYVETLTGEKLMNILTHSEEEKVEAAIPKFESEYGVELSGLLQKMGMSAAFDGEEADFSGLGTYEDFNLFISRVLHKAYISVDESGTRAGAATVVEIRECAMEIPLEEIKTVYLDRPFVYMLIDCETKQPIFMGTVMSVEQ